MENKRKTYAKDIEYHNTGTVMLTADDVHNRLNIGINKARNLMKLKGFPSIRLGGCLRVPEPEFEEWIHRSVGMTFDV